MPRRRYRTRNGKNPVSRGVFTKGLGIALAMLAGGGVAAWLLSQGPSSEETIGSTAGPEGEPNSSGGSDLEGEFEKLNEERKKLIEAVIAKPNDLTNFPAEINGRVSVAGIQLSLNGQPSGISVQYSPSGVQNLVVLLNLAPRSYSMSLHLYTGDLGNPAETSWQSGNCNMHVPIEYMSTLAEYVLPLYPESEWDARQQEIIEQWNLRLNSIAYHEATHASRHYQVDVCTLVSETPILQAEIEAMRIEQQMGPGQPAVFWVDLAPEETLSGNSLVNTFWQEYQTLPKQ